MLPVIFALARRDGKNCLPFLASLMNADAEVKKRGAQLHEDADNW